MRTIEGTMIDTETLGLKSNALVWEIAAVPFRIDFDEDGADWRQTDEAYHAIIDYRDHETSDFAISMGTMKWTAEKRQGEPGWEFWRQAHFDPCVPAPKAAPGVAFHDPGTALLSLKLIVRDKPVWFRNASFDVPKFDALAASVGEKMPWHRRQQSDLYTLVNQAAQLHGYEDDLPNVSTHRALEDALGQIDQACRIHEMLYCPNSDLIKDRDTPAFG